MTPSDMKLYLKTSKEYIIEDNIDDLKLFIEIERKKFSSNSVASTFYAAESAFYNQEYYRALKSYIITKEIPYFNFFCYRSASFAYEKLKLYPKAIDCAKKALKIIVDDTITLHLLTDIYQKNPQEDKKCMMNDATKIEDSFNFISLGVDELKDLNDIFQTQ